MSHSTPDARQVLVEHKWATALLLLVLYASTKVIYARFLSPTKHIPGPLWCKISKLPWSISTLRGRKMYMAKDLVAKHGPVVEVAPGIIFCSSPDTIKTVYSSLEWKKSRFYSDFADIDGVPSLFSELRTSRVQILRRAFLPAFSRANIVAMSTLIFEHLNKFLVKLDEFERAHKAMEAYSWTRYLTFEVVTDLGFGGEYDMISNGEVKHPFVADFDDAVAWGITQSLLPFINHIPSWAMPQSFLNWRQSTDRNAKHAQDGLDKWREQKEQGKTGHRVDILQRLIEHGDAKPSEKLSDEELKVEILEIMIAGSDTTATTVTYGLYELAKHPAVQAKLRKALREGVPDASQTSLVALENVSYLDWTIKEMFRLHPTLPSMLERVVPPQGAEIAGYRLSGGTVVGTSAWAMNKLPELFPEPEAFQPERWENATSAMNAGLFTFSTGPRSCVGKNLGMAQTRIHVGTIVRDFEVSLHPDTTEESMRTLDYFQGKPATLRTLLYFKRVG